MTSDIVAQGKPVWPIIRSILLFLVGPVFAFLTLMIANGWDISIGNSSPNELLWALIAYVAAEHLARIIDRISSEFEIRKGQRRVEVRVDNSINSLRRDLHSSLMVSRLTDNDFYDKIEGSLRLAYHVRNTFVGISDLTAADSASEDRVLGFYPQVLKKSGSTWDDIVGIRDLAEARFTEINKSNSENLRGVHSLHVIDTHAPILNFVIIGPRESPSTEVYFGWVKGSNSDIERFHSTDPRIIKMFEYYFDSLRTARNVVGRLPVPYHGDPRDRFAASVVHRWQGVWLSISGSVKTYPTSTSSPNKNNQEVSEFALITISYEHDWKIIGEVFDLSMNLKYTFESDMCSLDGKSLFYKFYNKGRYNYVQSDGLGSYSIAIDQNTLVGHYSRRPYTKASITRAMKLSLDDVALLRSRDADRAAALKRLIAPIIEMPTS